MKVIVSGSTGFIGSNLMPRLAEAGHHAEGISRSASRSDHKVHTINLNSGRLGKKIHAKNYDAVIHLAADTREKDLTCLFSDNVTATLNLLEFAREMGIKKFIFVSGHNVYSASDTLPIREDHATEPNTNYGITKLLSENLVSYYHHRFGIEVIILRVTATYGNGQPKKNAISKFINRYKNSEPIFLHKYQNGFQMVDLIHVFDVCDAIIKALESKKRYALYNIASGRPITVQDIFNILKNYNRHTPTSEIINMGKQTTHFYYDIESAKRELDFEPKISLEEGVKNLLRHDPSGSSQLEEFSITK